MKVDLKERTAVAAPELGAGEPKRGGGRWVWVAISLTVAALAIGTFATLHARTSTPASRAVWVDPMTGVREAGPYAQTVVGPYMDPKTRFREGPYAQKVGPYVDPMTRFREGPSTQTAVGPYIDPMTRFREGGK